MKSLALKKALLGLLVACLSTGFVAAQSISFTATTTSYDTKPANVFACWITDSNTGKYIMTINRQSTTAGYTSSLKNWKAATGWTKTGLAGQNDGMTGATLSSLNQTLTGSTKRIPFTWNCKNSSGVMVPNGDYVVHIEFAQESNTPEQHETFVFTKGTTSINQIPNSVINSSYITITAFTYTAPATALTPTEVSNFDYTYSRSDRNLQLQYDAANHAGIQLHLINLKGQTIHHTALKGSGKETTQLPALPQGIYLLRLTDKEGWSQTQKLLL
ncbi:MAG: DUF2271 domain-containing protein [Bacteroidia bacterium]|nr:DUF2271 domain-containing protein [Bacteroidia bacterium]